MTHEVMLQTGRMPFDVKLYIDGHDVLPGLGVSRITLDITSESREIKLELDPYHFESIVTGSQLRVDLESLKRLAGAMGYQMTGDGL